MPDNCTFPLTSNWPAARVDGKTSGSYLPQDPFWRQIILVWPFTEDQGELDPPPTIRWQSWRGDEQNWQKSFTHTPDHRTAVVAADLHLPTHPWLNPIHIQSGFARFYYNTTMKQPKWRTFIHPTSSLLHLHHSSLATDFNLKNKLNRSKTVATSLHTT